MGQVHIDADHQLKRPFGAFFHGDADMHSKATTTSASTSTTSSCATTRPCTTSRTTSKTTSKTTSRAKRWPIPYESMTCINSPFINSAGSGLRSTRAQHIPKLSTGCHRVVALCLIKIMEYPCRSGQIEVHKRRRPRVVEHKEPSRPPKLESLGSLPDTGL